jgi:hypothetical protein
LVSQRKAVVEGQEVSVQQEDEESSPHFINPKYETEPLNPLSAFRRST